MAVVLEQALEEPRQARVVLDDEQVHVGQPSGGAGSSRDRDIAGRQRRGVVAAAAAPSTMRPPVTLTETSSPTATSDDEASAASW